MKKEVSTKKLVETIVEGIQNRKGQRIVTNLIIVHKARGSSAKVAL